MELLRRVVDLNNTGRYYFSIFATLGMLPYSSNRKKEILCVEKLSVKMFYSGDRVLQALKLHFPFWRLRAFFALMNRLDVESRKNRSLKLFIICVI